MVGRCMINRATRVAGRRHRSMRFVMLTQGLLHKVPTCYVDEPRAAFFEALVRAPANYARQIETVRAPLSDRKQRRIHQKLEGEPERHRRGHAEAP